MVIISCTVCNKAGKIMVSRQYTNITKSSLEESIKNFPKSISALQQHTFVENDHYRYVYLPLETMYLVLLTNKNSNIIEDIETVRLVHKVVVDLCPLGLNEANIAKNGFDILLAFDDVISFGYRESVTAAQIQNSLAMDSSEEKLHIMLMKAKLNDAREKAKMHQLQSARKKKDDKDGKSFSSHDGGSDFLKKVDKEIVINERPSPTKESTSTPSSTNVSNAHAPKKAMQLGKKKPEPTSNTAATNNTQGIKVAEQQIFQEEAKKAEYNPLQKAITVEFEEKLNCQLQRDGALNSFEVKGEVFLTVHDPSKTQTQVILDIENPKNFNVRPHPNLDKAAWNDKRALARKEGFPQNNRISTVKYRYASTDANDVPITFAYWPSDNSVTFEVEFNSAQSRITELSDLVLAINFPAFERPNVNNIDNGDFQMAEGKGEVKWMINKLDKSNRSASIDIAYSNKTKIDDIFPLIVDFKVDKTFFKAGINSVIGADGGSVSYDITSSLSAENWKIN